MASQSALHASTVRALCARVEAHAGVEHARLDEQKGALVVLAAPGADLRALEWEVRAMLEAEGVDPLALPVEVVSHTSQQDRHRVRFMGVERWPEPEGHARMRVTLEWDGALHVGEAVGEASTALEMRTAAAAAVKAVEELTPRDLRLRLIGVKQIRAFDQEITVVSIFQESGTPQRLVGAVLTSDDPLKTSALAVLNALNRILGNYLSTVG